MVDSELIGWLFMGMLIGVAISLLTFWIFMPSVALSSETAHDLCVQITSNTAVEAHADNQGKLICELPSYDHTTNIIIINPIGATDR